MNHLFTQDGHLSDLTLERIFAGEALPDEVHAHLESCEICRERLEAIAQHEASYRPVGLHSGSSRPSRRSLYGTILAAAAAALIFVAIQEQQPAEGRGHGRSQPNTFGSKAVSMSNSLSIARVTSAGRPMNQRSIPGIASGLGCRRRWPAT